ncbi:MAG: hypothetical protein AAGC68_06285, partial [Verrucomicrobiota bacterium]
MLSLPAFLAAPATGLRSGSPGSTSNEKHLEAKTTEVLAQFGDGNEIAFLAHWDRVLKSETDEMWRARELEKLATSLVDREKADKGEPWIGVYRSLLDRTDPRFVSSIPSLENLAAPHAIAKLKKGQQEKHFAWFQNLEEKTQRVYFTGLKHQNRFIRELQNEVNPRKQDPDMLPDQPRLSLVKEFLATPFFQRIQPFNNKTFRQLIDLKCLSPDELFANREAMVTAHERQGMAYLDLARIYRENRHFEEALNHIEIGMTLYRLNPNRTGCYLLEKAIILRESGEKERARQV